jgi:F-type H+-transporting ATPase subunit b
MKTGRILALFRLAILVTGSLLLPSLAFGAEESKWGLLLPVGRFFNLALVIGVLVWAARKPLASFYATRSEHIRAQLAEAQQARIEAEAKLAEIESRMSRMDEEVLAIKAAAEEEARHENERVAAQARLEASKITERARQEIEGLTRAARIELKAHVAELSVKVAEELIRREITERDRDRLFDRVLAGLGESK